VSQQLSLGLSGPSDAPAARVGSDTARASPGRSGAAQGPARGKATAPPAIGLGGLPAGPLQSALLEQLDAGRPVSEQQLLEAALQDRGCRLRRQQHQVGVYRTKPAAIRPPSQEQIAAAHEDSSRAFWAWRKRRTGGDDG
jgi:hypothetical protein